MRSSFAASGIVPRAVQATGVCVRRKHCVERSRGIVRRRRAPSRDRRGRRPLGTAAACEGTGRSPRGAGVCDDRPARQVSKACTRFRSSPRRPRTGPHGVPADRPRPRACATGARGCGSPTGGGGVPPGVHHANPGAPRASDSVFGSRTTATRPRLVWGRHRATGRGGYSSTVDSTTSAGASTGSGSGSFAGAARFADVAAGGRLPSTSRRRVALPTRSRR